MLVRIPYSSVCCWRRAGDEGLVCGRQREHDSMSIEGARPWHQSPLEEELNNGSGRITKIESRKRRGSDIVLSKGSPRSRLVCKRMRATQQWRRHERVVDRSTLISLIYTGASQSVAPKKGISRPMNRNRYRTGCPVTSFISLLHQAFIHCY